MNPPEFEGARRPTVKPSMDPEPWGIEGAREALAADHGYSITAEAPYLEPANPEQDLTLLRLELDACHQEITRLRFVLGQVAEALTKADEQ